MSEHPEYWTCPHCRTQQDIAEVGFFAEIVCPQCGGHAHVHSMLSNYKVESVLGIGGMSVVFKARDLVLGRPLAIKVLNDTYRDAPERISGFENECSFMAKVRHENVVSIYSAGWARGQFFIAMELVDGRNLELLVAESGSLPPLQAIEFIRQVALGLQAARDAGILHRDVKPGNVLITEDGKAKVLDFGLSLDEKDSVDEDEVIWATPYYVSPETLRREEETVRADIYALGMTFRNLLTGEATLPGMPQNVADMLVAKKTLPSLQESAPQLDSTLCKLVDSLTAFEPAGRPADYNEVLRRITKVQNRLKMEADPAFRLRRYMRRLYVAVGAVTSVAVGVAGAFAVAMLTPSRIVQETLNADALQWEEPERFMDAEVAILSGDKNQAEAALGLLTSEDLDPAVAAAAIFLRTALDVLDDKSPANGYRRFDELVTKEPGVAPMSKPLYDSLSELVAVLQKDVAEAAELAEALEHPLLKTAAMVLVADGYVQAGVPAKAEGIINQVKQNLDAEESAGLQAMVDAYGKVVPRRSARMWYTAVKRLFLSGDYEKARSGLGSLPEMKLSRNEKEEILVMKEASIVMSAIHDALKKHGRKAAPGMKPEDLRVAAAGMGETERVPREFYCVALVLSGNYDAAFRENPYASDSASQEPFAVMMRDWKARLGR
ncbi:MAG: protein kinase [Akkermansia sp.]|nr:protein kinase [Akkermansia sp.]